MRGGNNFGTLVHLCDTLICEYMRSTSTLMDSFITDVFKKEEQELLCV